MTFPRGLSGRLCAGGYAVALATLLSVAAVRAQPTDSPNHPDAARETQAKWQRLALLDKQAQEAAQRDAARQRREIVSLQFSANGWGMIVKPDGAVALVRQVEPGLAPTAIFAPAGTADFKRLQTQIEKAWERKRKTRGEVAFLAGFKIAGEAQMELAPVFDVQLWNEIVAAVQTKLSSDSATTLQTLATKFPLQIVSTTAKQ